MPRKIPLRVEGAKETTNARLILSHARKTVSAFDKAFVTVRTSRGVSAGPPTDEEQDLIRAALVLAAAGLDSLTKHLIRESMPKLLLLDPRVQAGLEDFASRRIRGDKEAADSPSASKFLARVLAAESARSRLIDEYVQDLTGSSLQSADELLKASAALGLDPRELNIDPRVLKPVFEVRNKIIHELDIDLAGAKRKRQKRTREKMLADAGLLLDVGESLIVAVEGRLAEPAS